LLWSPYGIRQTIIFLSCGFFFFLFFLASSQPSQIGCLPYSHTWCGLSANLGCRSETCCTRLAKNTGRKKSPKIAIWAPSQNGHSPQFSAHVYCGQTTGWIKMPLGTEVGLGPGDIVLDWDPAPSAKKAQLPIFGPFLFWPNGRPSQLLLSSCSIYSFQTLSSG